MARDVNEALGYETETLDFLSETRPRPCWAKTETFWLALLWLVFNVLFMVVGYRGIGVSDFGSKSREFHLRAVLK